MTPFIRKHLRMKTLLHFFRRDHKGQVFRFNLFKVSPAFHFGQILKRIYTATLHAACILFAFLSTAAFSQETATDTVKTKSEPIVEVMVSAIRANATTPVTFSNFSKKEIEARNLGQDIPMLINFLPGVVTTSDAGNGFGYTGIRVRGSDATRVNVTINGIPYNDSESSGTYFVDLPDFASSLESIQLQRGVGTSTNGAGAFGASLNLLTEKVSDSAHGAISNSFGSFNSRKHTVKFSTGTINDHFEMSGRLSALHSDGYIDRATSDLKSYFLQGTYIDKNATVKAIAFGGNERTYQSWFGVDAATLASDPTFNYAGMFTDEAGNMQFYKDQVDDYTQNNYQLHYNQRLSSKWNSNLAFHYTKGKGYYEEYKEDQELAFYGISSVVIGAETVETSDLVRRKWLDNDFYGMTFSVNHKVEKLDLIIGGGINNYEGAHFGEVIWARFASASESGQRYYDQDAVKTDLNVFNKITFKMGKKWLLFTDIQFRYVKYDAILDDSVVAENYSFFNPKTGLTFLPNAIHSFYLSVANAAKEPTRTDFENGAPKAEFLTDVELGWRVHSKKLTLNANLYFMHYNDQLVKTGELDDVGNEIHANVDKSYRAGIEVDANFQLTSKFSMAPNIAFSQNKIVDYTLSQSGIMTNLGTTNISFSPEIIGGLITAYAISPVFRLALYSKFVGNQYAGNLDTEQTKIDSYFTNDFSISYDWNPKSFFKSILFTALVNNIFDKAYVSNAYLYGEDYLSYFPQAGINFLAGATIKF